MASVDLSIYSNLLAKPKSVEDYRKDDQAIESGNLLNALRGSQVRNALQGEKDDSLYRSLTQGFGNDVKANARTLQQNGLPTQSDDYLKTQTQMQGQQAQTDMTTWELAVAKQKRIADLAAGAKDQASWSMARNAVGWLGADVSQIPEEFSPELAARFASMSMTQLQHLERERQARLDAEAERHHREAEKGTARGYALREKEFSYRQESDREDRALRRELGNRGWGGTHGGASPRPMPAAALKLQQEELDAIGGAGSIDADLGEVERKLTDGELELGPWENLKSKGRNAAGLSSPNSQNYASFMSTLERLRNESLRLNKGVQTEGDAVRAWNELISNANDQGVVKQRLAEIRSLNQRAADLRRLNVDQIRSNYGHESIDTEPYSNQQPANRPQMDSFSGDKSKRPPLTNFQR